MSEVAVLDADACKTAVKKLLSSKDLASDLLGFFGRLPAESTRDYEKCLTCLAVLGADEFEPILRQVFMPASKTDDPVPPPLPPLDSEQEYAAFFALNAIYRRRRQVLELDRLLHTAKARNYEGLDNHGTYKHLYSMFLTLRAGPKDREDAADCAQKALNSKGYGQHPGLAHNYAAAVIAVHEAGLPTNHRLTDAEYYLTVAFREEKPDYAKFHATRGRLLALKGDVVAAREELQTAMRLEDALGLERLSRLSEYELSLVRIESKGALKELSEGIKELSEGTKRLREETDKASLRHIEILGFFAAIVSFILATLQAVKTLPFLGIAQLSLMMSASLLMAFSGFNIIVHGSTRQSIIKSMIIFGIGLLIVAVALWLVPFASKIMCELYKASCPIEGGS